MGKLGEAVAAYRQAVRLQPEFVDAHWKQADCLYSTGDLPGASAEYCEVIRCRPASAEARYDLANVLPRQGRLAEACAAYGEAIRLKPDHAQAHCNLGAVLAAQGKPAEAVAEFRTALRLKPDLAEAHCNLGLALESQGELAAALAALRRGHALGTASPGWRYPSTRWVEEVERLRALEVRLPAVLNGQGHLTGDEEWLAFAALCRLKRLYVASARFYADLFASRPGLTEDWQKGTRYNAACSAALAGAGQSRDVPAPDAAERHRWREQALVWLRAELILRAKQPPTRDSESRRALQLLLQHWQADPDLAGVRDQAALAKLPEAEQAAWRKFWSDVEGLRQQARER
jgi:tetratricopeptide (TPR) repeat protein